MAVLNQSNLIFESLALQRATLLADQRHSAAQLVSERWTPVAGQVLNEDKCFPQDERNALERSNEKEETYPFTRVQSEGRLSCLPG
jgi:hypothetical protein